MISAGMAARATEPALAAPAAEPVYVPPQFPPDILKLDDEMRRFFADRITASRYSIDRLHEIVDAILRPSGLNFQYESDATFDAREAFRRRRGNCVTFAMLVTAVAREFGLEATFQNVEAATRWNHYGDIVVSVMHLNVRVDTDDGLYVVDLRPDLMPSTRVDAMQTIRDERAFAQFYSNVGFFRLVCGEPVEALRYMTFATTIDPNFAAAWTNCGNVNLRMNKWSEARACFERALRADRNDLAAASSLLGLLTRSGTPADLKAAQKLERRAEAMRSRNPYFQQRFAEQAQERGDWKESERLLRRAISLKNDEPDFYVELIATLRQLGREADAKRMERKLEALRARVAAASVRYGY